jgi:hypothetical protein
MTLFLDHLDAAVYRRWARWMLALDPAPCSTRYADALFRDHHEAIGRVATTLADALLPRIWSAPDRLLYRGLRLEDPALHGRPLPPHRLHDTLPALSFTEDLSIACYFADPGPRGMPALAIPNTATGKLGLPPHGYIAMATVRRADVLFHWRYASACPGVFASPDDDLSTVFEQREVTVRNRPDLAPELQDLEQLGYAYLAAQYGVQ